jgi:hypothetical protein
LYFIYFLYSLSGVIPIFKRTQAPFAGNRCKNRGGPDGPPQKHDTDVFESYPAVFRKNSTPMQAGPQWLPMVLPAQTFLKGGCAPGFYLVNALP